MGMDGVAGVWCGTFSNLPLTTLLRLGRGLGGVGDTPAFLNFTPLRRPVSSPTRSALSRLGLVDRGACVAHLLLFLFNCLRLART